MELPQILHYIAGPLIGALIGYCTNYIAVKMLLHPHHEVKVLGRTLPFTPGVIPKNKPRLAHAIGEAVANVLLTKEDIAGLITDERVDSASTALVAGSGLFGDRTLEDLARAAGMEDTDTTRLEDFLSDKIWESLQTMDIAQLVGDKAQEVIRSKPMLMLLPVDSILSAVTVKVDEFVKSQECRDKIGEAVHGKVAELKQSPTGALLGDMGLSETAAEAALSGMIHKLADTCLEPMLQYLNISQIIEDKINAMDIQMFEDLVMSVMKNELNAIVNLGFLIGLIIGIINIFI